jgi:phosphohistidine phosphatase
MGALRMTDMDLIVWRHADAGDAAPDLASDAARPLTERGRKQAERMARWLQARLPERYSVLSSPAARARETAEALGVKVRIDERLAIGADVADVLAALNWPEGPESRSRYVVVVGHQPTLGRLVSLLMSGHEADWSIRKGAIWWLSSRAREGREQVVLRAVLPPDLA